MSDTAPALTVTVSVEQYPRYDPAHGTPDPMIRRLLVLTLSGSTARFEQTDYGHPGRFNAWEPRGVDAALLSRTDELKAACEVIAPLLS